MKTYAYTVRGWHDACEECGYPFDEGERAFATDPDPAFAAESFCGRTCARSFAARQARRMEVAR